MKHIKFLSLAITFVMALAACAPAQADQANKTEQTDPTEQTAKQADRVLKPASDTQLRPDMKPDQVTVIDFNATWCGPCKFFAPIFHKAANKFHNAKFYSVDTDEYSQTASAFGIRAIPTIVIISPSGKTQTIVGIGDELTAGISEDATDEQFEQAVYDNFSKLIMKAIANK